MTEQYKCPSYYDDNNVLQDCTCGKCGTTNKRVEEIVEKYSEYIQHIEIGQYDNKGVNIGYKTAKELMLEELTQHTEDMVNEVVEKLEELRREYRERFDVGDAVKCVGDAVKWISQGGNLTAEQADSIKYLGHYQAIDDIIKSLK